MKKLMNMKHIVLPVGFLLMLGVLSISPNLCFSQANIVGSMGGEMFVSPMGVASYSIPIEVVPGTCGMQPDLSVTYNSAMGRGVLGMGWDLSGLSSITRTQRDLYYDDTIGSVNFDEYDRFVLDGARLVKLSGGDYIAQNAVYGTEIENFTRVTLKGQPSNPTSLYFVAVTDQGQIVEYGKTAHSKLCLPQGGVLAWMIDKITDADGNYMEYYYSRVDTTGEIRLSQINYTFNDNASLSAYAHVCFEYTSDPNYSKTYIGGNTVTTSNLLDKIIVKYGSQVIRQYTFDYDFDRSTRLTAVILQDANGNELTRTTINWGNDQISADYSIISGISDCGKHVFDYNSDNIPDLLLTYYDSQGVCQWEIKKGNNTGGYETTTYSGNIGTSYPVFTIDYNGDGKDGFGCVYYDDDTEDYTFRVWDMENISLVEKFNRTLHSSRFLAGDFKGRGGTQLVFVGEPSHHQCQVTNSFDNSSFYIPSECLLSVTDLNGNGKADIQVVRENYIDVYEYDDRHGKFARILESSWLPNNPTQGFHGDFNGDGKVDYIYFTYTEGTGSWYLKMSKGKSYKPTEALPFNTTHGNHTTPTFPLLISDVNGDGKDDIIQPTRVGTGPLTLNVYYPRIYTSDTLLFDTIQIHHSGITDHYESDYQFADLNHDGKNEILYVGSIFQNPVVVNLPECREHDLVASVTNGYGMTTSLEFGYSNSPRLGFLGVDGKRVHYPLVGRLQNPDGIGGVNETVFLYGDAVFDYARRQFLGFGYHKVYCNGKNTKLEFEYDTTYHYLSLVHSLSFYRLGNQNEPSGYIADPSYWHQNNNQLHYYETVNLPSYKALSHNRFIPYLSASSTLNRLENKAVTVYTWLNSDGRVATTSTIHKTAESVNQDYPWISRDSTVYAYTTVTLPNEENAVRPSRVVNWHRRKNSDEMPSDTVVYDYSHGKPASVSASDSDGPVGTTAFTYNNFGLPVGETYTPYGMTARTKSYGYDNKGRFLTQETDVMGHTKSATFDIYTGLMSTETDVNNLTTHYQYDAFGRLTTITRPDHTVHNISYHWYNGNDFDDVVFYRRETETGTPETRNYYDILGRTTHTYCAGRGYDDIVYDAKGRVVRETFVPYDDPETASSSKTWHNFNYDNYDRVTTETCPYTNLAYSYYDASIATQHDYFVTVDDNIRNTQRTLKYDALGRLACAVDEGGDITYDYSYETVAGKTRDKMTVKIGSVSTTVVSDLRGNRLSIQDPDAGTVTSTYNALNQLVSRTDANGNQATYNYDLAGRVIRIVYSNGSDSEAVIFGYDSAPGKGIGKLASVQHETELECEYFYDTLGRVSNRKVYDGNSQYDHLYAYDTLGRLLYLTYPDGFQIKNSYNEYSELSSIHNADNNELIYAISTRNTFRQPLKCHFGNDAGAQYTYNAYGMLTGIKNGDVTLSGNIINSGGSNQPEINYTVGDQYRNTVYTYNGRGFIATKTDTKVSQSEAYSYDDLDRLDSYRVNGVTAASFTYDNNGNISTNSKVGTYNYGTTKPQAVTSIDSDSRLAIQPPLCDVTYNLRNRPDTLYQNGYHVFLDYDASGMRRHTVVTNGQTLVREKTRISELYEEDATPTSARRLDYIYAEGQIVAVRVDNGSTQGLYYVLTDHLGSWEKVLDENKTIAQQTHFDPWGNRMSYTAWNTPQTQTSFTFDRGFTGHEHYDFMHLINANARLYDPVIGRFFSPDSFVQVPDFTQSYNRYSYCLNNPVMYSDPDGENFLSFISPTYFLFLSETGYELQKYISPVAFHFEIHLSSEQKGIGYDVSIGDPKSLPFGFRLHEGVTYYWKHYDNSYKGWESRRGGEWTAFSFINYSGTTFGSGATSQTTNAITLGGPFINAKYENDYMFGMGKYFPGVPAADDGDRYRSAAARLKFGELSFGVNLFTGDPGGGRDGRPRKTFSDPENNGWDTYVMNEYGDDPDKYRAGVFYVGLGSIKIGWNSESIRNHFQNEMIHKPGGFPYFKVLNIEPRFYFYFGTSTGNSLW